MEYDRITAIRVQGLRSLADVALDLSDLTVLIGPNGAGKSSLVEVCELLRMAGREPFLDRVSMAHGGAAALVRRGEFMISLVVDVSGADGTLRYRLELVHEAPYLIVQRETLHRVDVSLGHGPLTIGVGEGHLTGPPEVGQSVLLMQRDRDAYYVYDRTGQKREALAPGRRPIMGDELALRAQVGIGLGPGEDLYRMCRALASIEVHPPINVQPRWVSPDDLGARGANVVRDARRLDVGGKNLSNALLKLRNQRGFDRVMEDIRIGLGDDIEDLVLQPTPSGGQMSIEFRIRGVGDIPLFSLSDGQVAFLAQVVNVYLERTPPPALVVLDEPDLHFHPGLSMRLAQMIEGASQRFPVLVATQSDAFLDALSEPAAAAVLCELGANRATELRRPDPAVLAQWLSTYTGLGDVRRNGYEPFAFSRTVSRASDGS